jgi:hypothetical protein
VRRDIVAEVRAPVFAPSGRPSTAAFAASPATSRQRPTTVRGGTLAELLDSPQPAAPTAEQLAQARQHIACESS